MKKAILLFSILVSVVVNTYGQITHNETVTIQPSNYGPKLILNDASTANKVPIEFRSNNIIKWELGARNASGQYDLALWRFSNNTYIPTMWFNQDDGNVGIDTDTPSEKLQIGNSYTFHDGGHKVLGFMYGASGGVDLSSTKYAAELRFDPDLGNLRLGTSSSVTNTPTTHMTIAKDGNIGIGTTTPSTKFDVNGRGVTLNRDSNYGQFIDLKRNNSLKWQIHAGITSNSDVFSIRNSSQSSIVTIHQSGNVGIGTTDTKGFKLGVEGKIAATEVKIATYANWSDFVFKSTYNLPTLKEVEQHIKENGHLKDIPSAEEVKKDGFFLGEMDSKLLQKIEELTLYTIGQQKEIEKLNSLKEENKLLHKKFEALEVLVLKMIKNNKK